MLDLASREGYVELLKRVISQIESKGAKPGERVIELKPYLLQEHRQTIITNFRQLANSLNREPQHLARFIFKESGKPGTLEGDRLILSGRLSNEELAKLLQLYYKEFVKCPVCGGVDTRITSEKRFRFLVCDACGAKNSTRKI